MNQPNQNSLPQMLLVDDDRHLLESMCSWLATQGFDVHAADSCASAKALVDNQEFDVAIVDLRLGDGDGFDVLEHCRRCQCSLPVILLTGYGTVETGVEAIRAGAFDLLTKPLIDQELLMSVQRAISQQKIIEENDNLKKQLDNRFGLENIVGTDPRMIKTFEIIDSVADTRATV